MLCQITFLRHHPKNGGVTAAKVNIFFNYELKMKNEEGVNAFKFGLNNESPAGWGVKNVAIF